jgi:hypothetical protein
MTLPYRLGVTATCLIACTAIVTTAFPMFRSSGLLQDIVSAAKPAGEKIDAHQPGRHVAHNLQQQFDWHREGGSGRLEDLFAPPSTSTDVPSHVNQHTQQDTILYGEPIYHFQGSMEGLHDMHAWQHGRGSSVQTPSQKSIRERAEPKRKPVSETQAMRMRSVGRSRERSVKRVIQPKSQDDPEQSQQYRAKGKAKQETTPRLPPLQPWMERTPNYKMITMYRVYEHHTRATHNTAVAYIRSRCTQELGKELLSKDEDREKAAILEIGVPEDRRKGPRTMYWGKKKNDITRAFAKHYGIDYDQAVRRLDTRLTEPIAKLLASPETFKQGADLLPHLRAPNKKALSLQQESFQRQQE